jgi:glycerol-3-phosphate dehydrogenase (NAD(P)+)
MSLSEAVESLGMVAEGVKASKIAYELCQQLDMRSPLIQGVYRVVHEGIDPRLALGELMAGAVQDDIDPSLVRAALKLG